MNSNVALQLAALSTAMELCAPWDVACSDETHSVEHSHHYVDSVSVTAHMYTAPVSLTALAYDVYKPCCAYRVVGDAQAQPSLLVYRVELRRRFTADNSSATAFAVSPGNVRSDIWRTVPLALRVPLDMVMRCVFLSTEQGCYTSVIAGE
eukprot:18023-Heterococcus_DN1.PRE.5